MNGILAVALLFGGSSTPAGDGWFGRDKAKHFLVSAVLQSISFSALETAGADRGQAIVGSAAITLGIGVGKELYDRRQGRDFSVRDLAWDAAGAGAAAVAMTHLAP